MPRPYGNPFFNVLPNYSIMHHFTLIHIQILSFWGVSPYWNCVNYPFSFVPSGIILCFHTFQLTHSIYYFSCVLHFRGCWILMWICYFLSLLHTGHPSAALRFSSLLLGSSFTLIFLGCILKEFSQKRRFSPFLSLQMILFCWQVTIVHFFFFFRLKWMLSKNFGIVLFYSCTSSRL